MAVGLFIVLLFFTAASLDSWQRGQRVEINYSKLMELCLHSLPQGSDADQLTRSVHRMHTLAAKEYCRNSLVCLFVCLFSSSRLSHDQFMAEYSSIFNQRRRTGRAKSCCNTRHSCRGEATSVDEIHLQNWLVTELLMTHRLFCADGVFTHT